MSDCPNCGADIPDGIRLCPSCGFDSGEAQAERVRELREQGRIHPGRVEVREDEFRHGEPIEDPSAGEEPLDVRETEGGL